MIKEIKEEWIELKVPQQKSQVLNKTKKIQHINNENGHNVAVVCFKSAAVLSIILVVIHLTI